MFGDIFKQKKEIDKNMEDYKFLLPKGEVSEEVTSEERNLRKKWKDITMKEEIFLKQGS